MSEFSNKSSTKKAFKAPVLKVSEDAVKSNKSDPSEAKASKTQKRELKHEGRENNLDDKGFSQKVKKEKKKKEKKEEPKKDNISPKKEHILKKKYEESKKSAEADTSPKEKKTKKKHKETEECGKSETSPQKEKNFKKPQVSLSDSQYEEIFKAALQRSNSQHNTPIEELLEAVANSTQKSSVKDCQKEPLADSEGSVKTYVSLKDRTGSLPELSPWGSHLSKQNSQASSILKELQESQATSLLSPEPTSSSEDSDADADVVLSQKSVRQLSQRSYTDARPTQTQTPRRHKVDKRSVLEELQAQRNVGLWVFCDRMTCQKQRHLPHVTDPQELPDVWYCHMNPDPRYNSCQCEEQQLSAEEEEDMIDNQYTCGSVVWARLTGFPWWPALVDDDPDLECYYWLEEDMRTVTFYHVVFFDKNEVTRAWIPTNKVVSFKKNPNISKQRVVRGIDFTPRLRVAREQAEDAVTMTVVQRLKKYSFIARYKGPILDDQTQIEKTKKKYKLKCSIGKNEATKRGRKRRANTNEDDLTPFESVVKTNSDKKDQKRRKLSVKEIEKKSVVENGSDTNIELSVLAAEVAYLRKMLSRESKTGSFVPLNSEANNSTKPDSSKLSSDVEKQSINVNAETDALKQITKENEDFSASETPSGICYDSKIVSAGETAENSLEKVESKPPSVNGSNASQKSKGCSSKPARIAEEAPEDSVGSVVEPSQVLRPGAEDEDSQQTKLSQSTIADYLAAESEDAVVPETSFSQQSEPFEE